MPGQTVSRVQDAFLAEVQKKGIESVLGGIGGWFYELATARMEDEFRRQLGQRKDDREGRRLVLMGMALDAARCVNNYSTAPGQNLLKQAEAAVYSAELARLSGSTTQQGWVEYQARTSTPSK
jgi:hypothetical protein